MLGFIGSNALFSSTAWSIHTLWIRMSDLNHSWIIHTILEIHTLDTQLATIGFACGEAVSLGIRQGIANICCSLPGIKSRHFFSALIMIINSDFVRKAKELVSAWKSWCFFFQLCAEGFASTFKAVTTKDLGFKQWSNCCSFEESVNPVWMDVHGFQKLKTRTKLCCVLGHSSCAMKDHRNPFEATAEFAELETLSREPEGVVGNTKPNGSWVDTSDRDLPLKSKTILISTRKDWADSLTLQLQKLQEIDITNPVFPQQKDPLRCRMDRT